MARVSPFVPETITVHLGAPASPTGNVTVPFIDYIKNVSSSEVYPTWYPCALFANIHAQISYALNRVYLDYYPGRGYNFDITSDAIFDQKYIFGRTIFENISNTVDEYFDTYIRRIGFTEPLAALCCNGTTVTCDGLSQWGSQELAAQEIHEMDILRTYYGDDIELVPDTRVESDGPSCPGVALSRGSSGEHVGTVQNELNRISQKCPQIPKIGDVTEFYDELTEEAVISFQEIFGLRPTGVVKKATWYMLVFVYNGITRLDELNLEGQQLFGTSLQYTDSSLATLAADRLELSEGNPGLGDEGEQVQILQHFLNVLSAFYPTIPPVPNDGVFEQKTHISVIEAQRALRLPVTGIVDEITWNTIYDAYNGIVETVFIDPYIFPQDSMLLGSEDLRMGSSGEEVRILQRFLNGEEGDQSVVSRLAENGFYGRHTRWAVNEYQKVHNLPQTGIVDEGTRDHIINRIIDRASAFTSRHVQFPGKTIKENDRDEERI